MPPASTSPSERFDAAVAFNALAQLDKGTIPWTVRVPHDLDPLPFYTSHEICLATNGFTLTERCKWTAKGFPGIVLGHHDYVTGFFPRPDRPFVWNVGVLAWDIARLHPELMVPLNWPQDRADQWARSFITWPHLYGAALRKAFA